MEGSGNKTLLIHLSEKVNFPYKNQFLTLYVCVLDTFNGIGKQKDFFGSLGRDKTAVEEHMVF